MRNRKHLYLSASFAHFQPRKASQPDGGGATGGGDMSAGIPDAGGNNGTQAGGNQGGGSASSGSESNNSGETFDPTTFWDGPPAEPGAAPSGESAGSGTQTGGNEPSFAQGLATQLSSLAFGDPVFTPEITAEINEGNFAGFEKRLQAQQQAAVKHALALNVQILRPFAEQLMNQMREEMGSTLTGRDNNDTLIRDFPAAKDARVAPVIKQVFEQALKNNKGNREAAVKQTKSMIQLLTNTTADDLDLDVAPRGAGDSRPSQPAINWLDELTGRG